MREGGGGSRGARVLRLSGSVAALVKRGGVEDTKKTIFEQNRSHPEPRLGFRSSHVNVVFHVL